MADGVYSGLSTGTSGSQQIALENCELENASKNNEQRLSSKRVKYPIFSRTGHITLESVSARREFFLGKSVAKIENILRKHGYITKRRNSIHATSKAKVIITTNSSKERNITQVQISPGSQRHGGVPYVKISTTDYGRIKIIGTEPENYKTDGKETATLLFRRKKHG